jgi:hypothetical protein
MIGDATTTFQFWTCDVPHTALRRYQPLLEREAYALYPRLQRFVGLALQSLATDGDLPLGVGLAR